MRLGVLVPPLAPSPPAPHAPPPPLLRAALALRDDGIELVFGHQLVGGVLHGLLADDRGLQPVAERPRALYDRFPSQGRATDWSAMRQQRAGLLWATPPELTLLLRDKLRSQRAMEAQGLAMPELEDDPRRFASCLAAWGAAFLKPRFGSLGAGVLLVHPGDPLPDSIAGLQGRPEPALLQRAVPPPAGRAGRCLRVLMQRRPDGSWWQAPGALRESASDPVVNAERGAQVIDLHAALPPSAVRAAQRLAEHAGRALAALPEGDRLLEVGLDLVFDDRDQPHLIELNGRPRGRLERLARQAPDAFSAAHQLALVQPLRTLAAWSAATG